MTEALENSEELLENSEELLENSQQSAENEELSVQIEKRGTRSTQGFGRQGATETHKNH